MHEAHEIRRCQAHHGATVGVEAHRRDDGEARARGTFHRGHDFFLRRHGLDPDDVGTTGLQSQGLLAEGGNTVFFRERAQGLEQLAGRAHRARNHDLAATLVGDAACDLGRALVDLGHAVLKIMQLQPVARPAEGIGEDDVGPGIDKALMQPLDAVDMVEVPKLRRVAGLQAHLKQIGAGGAVRHQEGLFRQQPQESVTHLNFLGNSLRKPYKVSYMSVPI